MIINIMNELQSIYDTRSEKKSNNFILWIRGEYYKFFIIPVIKKFIKETSLDGGSVLYGKILERGSGQGHKMLKTIKGLLGDKFEFIGVEPSAGMRKKAEKKISNDNRVTFVDGFAEDLPFENESIDFIFDIQMQHHHPEEKKKEMINEANRVLKQGAHIYILDTFVPPDTTIFSSVKQKVFSLLQGAYVKEVGKGEYHNGLLEETIKILEKEGFEINQKYSRGFKVFLGHVLGIDFVNQIIATKK